MNTIFTYGAAAYKILYLGGLIKDAFFNSVESLEAVWDVAENLIFWKSILDMPDWTLKR